MNVQFERVDKYVRKIQKKYIDLREYLHAHPELGRQEFQTSKYLKKILRDSGYKSFEMVGPTGFTTDLITDKGASWIALRADIDALPIYDKKNVPYRSVNEGICHACGHDFHSAVVAGVAKTLKHFEKILKGNVRFIFQHAEEPIPGGAIDFLENGKLNGIQAVYGLHADPELKVGHIGLRSGWITAQSIGIKIQIKGPGGHTARPHETGDPIFLGSQLLNTLYVFLSREQNPEYPFVFTIGKISGGDSYNSIAQLFEAEGTLRVTDEKHADKLLKNIENIVKNITLLSPVSVNFEFKKGAPPVINDKLLTKQVREILNPILYSNRIHEHPRSMGGEDFSYYLRQTPGVFIRIGVSKGKKSAKLHTSEFDIESETIPFGILMYSWILINVLENWHMEKNK
jgi:amidohydrolase